QMAVFVYIVDERLSVLVLDRALIVLLNFIVHLSIETQLPIFLLCGSRYGMNPAKNASCFETIRILFCVRIIGTNLSGIFSVNPAKNGVNTVLTDAKFNWLTHRDSQRSDLFHPIEFRLFRIILRNVGNTQKIPCTLLISNTVLFVTRPAFIYRFFRYVFHL